MKKTILLCFIHGFKGGDDTFAQFPSHLKAILQHALPKVTVLSITYPKYETRGDLGDCVAKFKEWLTNKVIDLEVANGTPSPTVDPAVHTVLVGHSMGGIVAAETLLSIVNDEPVPSMRDSISSAQSESSTLMFPHIAGIMAFDTPYLGIAPGVVAHGAEKHWNTASSAYSAYNNVAQAFGWGAKKQGGGAVDASRMLPAPSSSAIRDANADAASAPLWQKYGRMALFAGAAGAVAAGGAAAYMKRDQITQGWSFATSHLEFVGSLARPEELKKRLTSVADMTSKHGLGFLNMYTTLGRAVDKQQQQQSLLSAGGGSGDKRSEWTGKVPGSQRTFCNLPKGSLKRYFLPAVNDKSEAETLAHMTMFEPKNNPGYYTMSEMSKEHILEWVQGEWYESSDDDVRGLGIEPWSENVVDGHPEGEGDKQAEEDAEREKEDSERDDEEFEEVRRGDVTGKRKRDEL